ncbi:arginyl-tRNA--protein transferase 1-like isoform X3 [Anneissia japonica]|uniref:arginyl-tRNA--protein transferase 1-like isoform X3 n=1 Tax=Anneissia japonica TaxID=1529436 RepID=UPI001425AAA0|nr:arginyl-tRNA--protein transferase 1-like isoform X3 [Anneissia japonica]
MSMSRRQEFSIVEYFFRDSETGSRCGYCRSEDTNLSRGMWAHKLTTQDYQDLIDRGWRRSGKYVYKPTMDATCCPAYTIRCEVLNFKPSRSQRKIMLKMGKYLETGSVASEPNKPEDQTPKEASTGEVHMETKEAAVPEGQSSSCTKDGGAASSSINQSNSTRSSHKKSPRSGIGPDPSKPLQKKAKVLRKEKKQQKKQQGTSTEVKLESEATSHTQKSNEPKNIEDYLCEEGSSTSTCHKLKIKLIRTKPASLEFQESFNKSYKLFQKYQMTIHNEPASECTEDDFKRFLCESPLEEEYADDGPACGYGSFHQQYWLDDELIAVGVLDILPHSISSVYLYYNPDYNFLTLGTYSSLREVAFTREIQKEAANIKYYYMGFYIHSCPKMRYKGQMSSSFLLCPEAYTWHPIENCRSKLDKNKYSRLDQTDAGKLQMEACIYAHLWCSQSLITKVQSPTSLLLCKTYK